MRLQADVPLQTPIGMIGRGVTADSIERTRSSFLDTQVRQQSADLGRYTTMRDSLTQVETVFGEPDDSGLGGVIDQFLSAFADLANDPSGQTPRALARQAAQTLTDRFHSMSNQLDQAIQGAQANLQATAGTINNLTGQIASLNTQIQIGEANGKLAPDLRDARDLLLDQLGQLVSTRVVEHDDGTIGVIAGDTLLVDNGTSTNVQAQSLPGGGMGLTVAGTTTTVNPGSGQAQALVDLTSTVLPGIKASLDTLAAGVVTAVNTLHRSGFNLAGATNVDFFDPAGTTAGSIGLSAAVQASLNNISAAGAAASPGDGSIALQIAQLRDTTVAGLGGVSPGDYYRNLVSSIGAQTQNATQGATAQETLVSNLESQRSADSGVSIDEELTNLITEQHAYAAAARLISTADQMLQELLNAVQ
jgi:flagellar hook-associated protein 1 FlgK